jgi:hypothetical protein
MITAISKITREEFEIDVINNVNKYVGRRELWDYAILVDAVFIVDMDGWFLVFFCTMDEDGKWKSCFEFSTLRILEEPIVTDDAVVLEERDTGKKYLFRYYENSGGWKRVEDILD